MRHVYTSPIVLRTKSSLYHQRHLSDRLLLQGREALMHSMIRVLLAV